MIKGMIFAAGLGTRLRPLTDSMPKAMVEVGGRPMLRRVIDKLVAAGVGEIVVNVHHFADQIKDYLAAEADGIGARVVVADESRRLLDTGGGLLAAAEWLEDAEAIVVHNADILSDASLDLMLAYHDYRGGVATLLIDPLRESSRRLLFDSGLRLRGRINLKTGEVTPPGLEAEGLERAAFGGIHVVSPNIFGQLAGYASHTGSEVFSITDFYACMSDTLEVSGYVAERPSLWFDVGRPESLAEARQIIQPA